MKNHQFSKHRLICVLLLATALSRRDKIGCESNKLPLCATIAWLAVYMCLFSHTYVKGELPSHWPAIDFLWTWWQAVTATHWEFLFLTLPFWAAPTTANFFLGVPIRSNFTCGLIPAVGTIFVSRAVAKSGMFLICTSEERTNCAAELAIQQNQPFLILCSCGKW